MSQHTELEQYKAWHTNGRSNVEFIDGGVRICRGHHEKNEPCEWTEYRSAPKPEADTASTDLIHYLRACADLAEQKGSDGLAYVSPVMLRKAIELLSKPFAVGKKMHPDIAAIRMRLEPRDPNYGHTLREQQLHADACALLTALDEKHE